MAWLPNDVIEQVNNVARIYYIDVTMCATWNKQRGRDELRLLTGWVWQSKYDGRYQMGLKTYTVTVRDAYYTLIAKQSAPGLSRARMRLVK